jgi:hypothetical protein
VAPGLVGMALGMASGGQRDELRRSLVAGARSRRTRGQFRCSRFHNTADVPIPKVRAFLREQQQKPKRSAMTLLRGPMTGEELEHARAEADLPRQAAGAATPIDPGSGAATTTVRSSAAATSAGP